MSSMASPLSNGCGFFVEKKKRFCKMIAASGKIYCGEHATMVSSGTLHLYKVFLFFKITIIIIIHQNVILLT